MPRKRVSFLALLFSNSQTIPTFGEAGFISTAIALVTVISLSPVLGVLLIRREATGSNPKKADGGVAALRRFCGWVAARKVLLPGAYTLLGFIVVCGRGSVHLELQPPYRLSDQVPDKEQPSRLTIASTTS